MTVTASAFKRLFVGKDAKYAVLGEDADLARISGESGDILTVGESVFGEGDYVEIAGHLRLRGPHTFDVKAYGAKGDGITNDAAAINLAATAAGAATNGGVVYFPPGTYYTAGNTGGLLRPKSNTVWTGAGKGLSVILYDDIASGTDCIGNNIAYGSTWDPLTNWTMRDLTLRGLAATYRTERGNLFRIRGDDILIENCSFEYSRLIGISMSGARNVVVRGCRVYRSLMDGIALWDCSDILIEGNDLVQCNDDSISCHSNDTAAVPVRSGVTIVNNRITEGSGIALLGLKNVVISGNILKRITGTAIRVRAPDSDVQGQSPQFVARITNNTITDSFKRSEPSPRHGGQFYIWLSGGTRRNGAPVPPGEIDPATGTAVSLYGPAGTGSLYANETGAGGAPMPAARGIDISGNILMRTLPAPTTISQWGYPESTNGIWVGSNGDGSGFYNGAISEANMNSDGILVDQALWESRICDNIINTGGTCGIKFQSTVAAVTNDFVGVRISGNQISNYTDAGIRLPNATTHQRITIFSNEFDADPFHIHSNRKTGPRDGSWLASGAPFGVNAQTTQGVTIEGNHFRNLADPVANAGSTNLGCIIRGNYTYSEPAALGFSTSNKGIGTIFRTGLGGQYIHLHVNCDPTSATYGQSLTNTYNAFTGMPTTGTYVVGHFVYNTAPVLSAGKTILGWIRLTTGNAHVLNTDWAALYVPNA